MKGLTSCQTLRLGETSLSQRFVVFNCNYSEDKAAKLFYGRKQTKIILVDTVVEPVCKLLLQFSIDIPSKFGGFKKFISVPKYVFGNKCTFLFFVNAQLLKNVFVIGKGYEKYGPP